MDIPINHLFARRNCIYTLQEGCYVGPGCLAQENLSDPLQAQFLCLIKDLHDGVVSKSQWEILMTQSPLNIGVKFEEISKML